VSDFHLDQPIHQPADAVFDYLTTFARQPEWQPGVLQSVQIPEGPVQVGTRVRKVRKTPVGQVTFTDEIIEYEPVRWTYAERVIDSMIRGSGSRWSVEATETGSILRVDVHVQAAGLWKLMEAFIVRSTKQDMRAALSQLRKVLERQAT
jgi:hypothetical protein